jgi:hypothetical protein
MNKQIIVFTEVHFTDRYTSILDVAPQASIKLTATSSFEMYTDFRTLRVPTLIALQESKSDDNFLAFIDDTNARRYYLVTNGSPLSNSFTAGRFCPETKSEKTICNDGYEALSAVLRTTSEDIKLFTSGSQALLNKIKLQIKADLIPRGATVVPFSNEFGMRGYIFEASETTPVIVLDANGNQYELAFRNMSRLERDVILSQLKLGSE